MVRDKAKQYRRRKQERGVALLLALFGTVFLSGYILINMNVDSNRVTREKVTQTAWLINELAQASRLYVRDQSTAGNPLYLKSALCTTPRSIPLNELITNGYLGTDIGLKNGAGTNAITPLNQTVFLIAANSTINSAACTTANLADIVATAYVIMQPDANMSPATLPLLSEALSNAGLPVSPPLFDAAGNNASPACNGGPATLQWNTGCLSPTQYSFLLPAIPFVRNTIGLPAWLAFRGDSRAVFRYAQPENPQAQRMETDIRMAPMVDTDTATCTQVNITTADPTNPTGSVTTPSGVCSVTDDTAGGTNNRLDITGVGTLDTKRLIIAPQTADAGAVDPATDLAIDGNSTITGNIRSFATNNSIVTGGNLVMSGTNPGLSVIPRTGGVQPSVRFNNLQTGAVQTSGAAVSGITSVNGNATVNDTLTVNNGLTINDPSLTGRGVIIDSLAGTATSLSISSSATIGGTVNVGDATNIAGVYVPTPLVPSWAFLSMATASLDTQNAEMNVGVWVAKNLSVDKTSTVTRISGTVNRCIGSCPDREPEPGSPLP